MTTDGFLALHICGLIDPIIEDIVDTGISFFSLDAPSSLEKFEAAVGTNVAELERRWYLTVGR